MSLCFSQDCWMCMWSINIIRKWIWSLQTQDHLLLVSRFWDFSWLRKLLNDLKQFRYISTLVSVISSLNMGLHQYFWQCDLAIQTPVSLEQITHNQSLPLKLTWTLDRPRAISLHFLLPVLCLDALLKHTNKLLQQNCLFLNGMPLYKYIHT